MPERPPKRRAADLQTAARSGGGPGTDRAGPFPLEESGVQGGRPLTGGAARRPFPAGGGRCPGRWSQAVGVAGADLSAE